MTNLQAMQDERLQDLIHQVEQLERLQKSLPCSVFPKSDSSKQEWEAYNEERKQRRILQADINEVRYKVRQRWKELLEEV